jgi:hypothetical protein
MLVESPRSRRSKLLKYRKDEVLAQIKLNTENSISDAQRIINLQAQIKLLEEKQKEK